MKNWRISCTRRSKRGGVLALLALGVLAVAALSLCLGAEPVDLDQTVQALLGRGGGTAAFRIVRYVRLPRTCAGLLAGAALAVSGVIIQGVLANSLAAPSTIGVNAGAGLAAAVCCALAPAAVNAVPFAALLGSFGGAMLVLFLAERSGAAKITVILAGMAVSAIFSAGIDAVITFVPEALNGYSDFRIGGLAGLSMARLTPACWLIFISLLAALSLHNELDVLMLGPEQAQSLGLPVRRLRRVFLLLAAALSGAAVSFSGLLSFVGLIVPHIMRRFAGEESGPLLAASALGGAGLLCGSDLLARMVFAPYEVPVGIVMSLVGGPFFVGLLLRRRGGVHR